MLDSLEMNVINECLDCAQFAMKGSWGEFIACGLTVVGGVFIRFFEKRRMKRKFRKGK